MRPSLIRSACTIAAIPLLTGCAAGIRSTKTDSSNGTSGLVYFLPKRDLVVTVSVSLDKANGDKKLETVSVAASEARPDFKAAFVATIPRNQAGSNEATIGINERGLLHSDSKTKTTSSLSDILKTAASLAGGVEARATEVVPTERNKDCPVGIYQKIFALDGTEPGELCGFDIRFTLLPETSLPKGHTPTADKPEHGLYYRLQLPYRVTVSKSGQTDERHFTIFSPTGSATYLLPLARSGFGSNSSEFAFTDGVPTKYKQDIGNELVGLLGAPASILEAYFAAIGSMFTSRKAADQNASEYLTQQNALALAEARRRTCADVASASNDLAAIKAACADK